MIYDTVRISVDPVIEEVAVNADATYDTVRIMAGLPGAAATVEVGSVTTGDAGTDASVDNAGSSSAAIFNFTIPRGVAGVDGDDAYEIAVAEGFVGDRTAWLASLEGTDGNDGDDGLDGNTVLYGTAAPTTEGVDGNFYIRTTTSYIYGPKAAGVWPSGVSLIGAAGSSGNTILSTTGAPSSGTGANGDFAYNAAAKIMYGPKAAGTWPAGVSLAGTNGSAATITLGSVTTGAAGSSVAITNSGTSAAAVFNFTVPRGDAGNNGTDGKTILYGTAAPTTEGVNGDFYIRTTTSYIYGPKAAGVWPAGTSLIGATGASGNTVLSTTGAPSSGTGSNGDFAYDSAAKIMYGPKAAGTWPAGVSLAGTNGIAATITLGSVTTGAAGSSVSINNSGTSAAAVFNFTIPGSVAANPFSLFAPTSSVSISTAGNVTYTAANVATGRILRDPSGGPRTDTFDTAANLISGLGLTTDYSFFLCQVVHVGTGSNVTLAAGTGGVLRNVSVITIKASALVVITRTSATTVSIGSI